MSKKRTTKACKHNLRLCNARKDKRNTCRHGISYRKGEKVAFKKGPFIDYGEYENRLKLFNFFREEGVRSIRLPGRKRPISLYQFFEVKSPGDIARKKSA